MLLLRFAFLGLCLLVLAAIIYTHLTRVTFLNQRGHVSPLYCLFLRPTTSLSKPIIFIPGLKGSMLAPSGKSVWLQISHVLFRSPSLLFHAGDAPFEPTGILTRLALIPGLIEYAPYQRISALLACHPNAYFFSYDWRLNPIEHIEPLAQLVARVQQETGQKPSIVAHSMGGLLTHAYIKQHPTTIDRVAYIGVPFQPGPGFVPDLEHGSPIGWNKTLLSKEVVFSHPSSFVLLPHKGQQLYKHKDLMDETTWKSERLSVFREGVIDESAFQKALTDARAFHAIIDAPIPLSHHFLFVVGNCQQAVKTIEDDGSIIFSPGDGRVLETASYPIEKDLLQKEIFTSCATHDEQMNDKTVVDRIMRFLAADHPS